MELRPNTNPDFSEFAYHIRLTAGESEVMAATYREHIHTLVEQGKADTIDDFDTIAAQWGSDQPHDMYVNSQPGTPALLRDFHEQTGARLTALMERADKPPFRNTDLAKRRRLGEAAALLATEMTQQLQLGTTLKAVHDLPEVQNRNRA